MKLNKIEKIVIAVIIAAGILAAGIVMFALPAYQKIEQNNKSLTAVQKELADINTTLLRKDTIDDEISKIRTSAEKFEGGFYPDLTAYEADEIVQAYLRENNVKPYALEITTFSTSDLVVTAYETTIVTYQLKEYSQAASTIQPDAEATSTQDVVVEYDADGNILTINGTAPGTIDKELRDLVVRAKLLSLTTMSQTVGIVTVTVNGLCEYKDYLTFVDYVADLERATYIPKLEFLETTDAEATGTEGQDGNAPTTAASTKEKVKDTTMLEFDGLPIVLYCVEPMGVAELETIQAGADQVVVNQ